VKNFGSCPNYLEKRIRGFKDSRGQVIVKALIQVTLILDFFLPLFLDLFKNKSYKNVTTRIKESS
jgi:hypothetical protein